MATVREKLDENQEKEFAYVVLHNGMDDVFTEINKFCKGEYGRNCELYEAYIAKKDPNNYATKAKEFDGVGADLLDKVRNHLEQARDFIRFDFTSADDRFSIDIVPGSEQDYLADRIREDDLHDLAPTDTVVMVELPRQAENPIARKFLTNL
jgi:pyruvate/oxaloacetate carboxyltransferase